MYVHKILVNHLGGLSLPRKSVARLTDRPDMTLDVYRGRKTTKQQQQPSFYYANVLSGKKTKHYCLRAKDVKHWNFSFFLSKLRAQSKI